MEETTEIYRDIILVVFLNIIKAKIKLAAELRGYDKVKNNNQIKALVDFLEYLFLIENPDIEKGFQ